jgi:hypothetical protein
MAPVQIVILSQGAFAACTIKNIRETPHENTRSWLALNILTQPNGEQMIRHYGSLESIGFSNSEVPNSILYYKNYLLKYHLQVFGS